MDVNQACSRIWVGGSAIAFAPWSQASWRERLLPRWLASYGFVCAALVLAVVLTGLPLAVHHATLVVVPEAVFYVGAGIALLRT